MLHFKYIPLFSVVINHNYYHDKIAADFDFIPLPSAGSILDAYGLRLKKINGRLIVFQQCDGNGVPLLQLDKVADLFFAVTVNTDLLNITELPGRGRYWFSNLKEDGSYSLVLTSGAELGAGDELPDTGIQQKVIQFTKGVIKQVKVYRLKAPAGWTEILKLPVGATDTFVKLDLSQPGLYRIEKELTAGGTEQVRYFLCDEPVGNGASWAVLHLQVKPGDANLDFRVDLKPKLFQWQYFLAESMTRSSGAININNLSFNYAAGGGSRYPANLQINFKDPNTYSDKVKQIIASIKSMGNIREVHLFESADHLEILDGEQPKVKVAYNMQDLVENIAIPARSRQEPTIFYKL